MKPKAYKGEVIKGWAVLYMGVAVDLTPFDALPMVQKERINERAREVGLPRRRYSSMPVTITIKPRKGKGGKG